MRKLILVLFLLSISAIYAQRTIDLPISTTIDTVDRFTTLYRPSAPTTLRQVTFKTVRDYFWDRINHWKNSNTWIDTVGVTTNLINVLLVKGNPGAGATVTAGRYITHVTNNDNTTAIGLYAKAMGGTINYAAYFDSGSVFVKKDLFVADSTFKVSTIGNIKKWGNRAIDNIPLTDTTKVMYSNGKWKIPTASADTIINYHWMGLHNFEQDSIKIGGLWYDFPATRIANSVLYDSLGNGILKWKVYPSGTTIDTTKISYLAKAETFTGAKTFNGDLIFGVSADLTLPTADPSPDVGKFWRSTDLLKYTNSVGDVKTLTIGSGTANEIAYWAGTNTLGTLPTASYPSLTELSYVKGVTSSIQIQLSGKLGTGLTNTYLFVGNGSGIATGVAMSGDATISNLGAVTVADDSHAHTGSTISGLAVADFTSPNISNWTNDASYTTLATVVGASNTWTNYNYFYKPLEIGQASLVNGWITIWNASNAFATTISSSTTTSNKTITLPNATGTVALTSDLSSYVPTARTLTINGTGYDLSANRSWTVTTDQTAAYSWTGLHKFISALLSVDTTGAYFNSYTATSGADIKGLTSYVYTSSNPTANKIYGGLFNATGSGTSGGSQSYGIYATATGSNDNYAGYFDATTNNAYAGYFNNGLVYIKDNLQVGAGKFIISTTGTLIKINNTLASDVSNYVLMSDGTSYTPINLLDRNNTWTGSTTYTPEGITYATTIDAANKTCISAGGTGNGTTTTISNGINGQVLILINTSSSFTWTLNETGNINLAGSADYVMGQSDTITLIYESGSAKWLETARSNN